MDDDVKTLLAILALVYGSSNGIGLLKEALDPVVEKTNALKLSMKNSVSRSVLDQDAGNLFWALWSPFVLIHVLMVLIVPTFLLLVGVYGPIQVLAFIGLASSHNQASAGRASTFYWILFGLSLVATAHYLSKYGKAWWALIKYLKVRSKHA